MNKVRVEMDSTDADKIVEIELTRDACEGVYALCHHPMYGSATFFVIPGTLCSPLAFLPDGRTRASWSQWSKSTRTGQ